MHFFDMYKTDVIRKRHFDDFADFALGKSIFFVISQLSTFRFFDLAINNRLDVEKIIRIIIVTNLSVISSQIEGT